VDPIGAFFIGIIGAVVMVYATDLLEYLRIDDPIGAVPVHMFAGMAGTMSLGLFASGAYGAPTATGVDTSSVVTGLFYGGGLAQLWIQAYGTITVCLAVFVVSMALMYGLKMTGALRVSQAGELEGLDVHEHGAPAYPEFVTIWGKPAAAGDVNGSVGSPTAPGATAPVSSR
jgi:Amt family ammonium transporter